MSLSEEARERLADVVQFQPTKNSELQDRWELESGSEVHQYLETELSEYYYRDDNSLIRATPEAADLVDVEPGIESDPDDDAAPSKVSVTPLQETILSIVPGPDERSASVVSVLQAVRETGEADPDVDEVRSGLSRLKRLGVVAVEYRTVPTYRLAVARDEFDVTVTE
ncbi:hypothetical protein C479_12027 [Halovivax asiaticus JCM 14624]|uniref:Uncharacterized protein n=1 Tax=Halovivax asiaticus JCM 14624 TaxID=1227490 RepID=M0BFP9_9EURY|nr:DUF5797 family protein [Halovivax asiaticus]ELZ09113.1 hypothetical protein C479_12027 [Halovivax asiaticus JCM 14624]